MPDSRTPSFCRFLWDAYQVELAFSHFYKITEYFSFSDWLRY